jgi:hypothetical protein
VIDGVLRDIASESACIKDDSCWLWLLLLLPLLLYLLFLLLYKWLKNLCCPPPVPIYVEDVNGKVYTVMANMTDTILSIKQKVALETGLPVHEHFLSFEEHADLKDRKALKYYGIKGGDTLYLNARFTIHVVRLPGKETFDLDVSKAHSVLFVKNAVEQQWGVPVDEQHLSFKGEAMDNNSMLLGSIGIENGSTVFLHDPTPPPTPEPTPPPTPEPTPPPTPPPSPPPEPEVVVQIVKKKKKKKKPPEHYWRHKEDRVESATYGWSAHKGHHFASDNKQRAAAASRPTDMKKHFAAQFKKKL